MTNDNLARALDDCLRAVAAGELPEHCLVRYPDLEEELAPLLLAADQLMAPPEPVFAPRARAVRRAGLMAAITRAEPPRRQCVALPSWALRMVLAPTLALVLIIIGLFLGLPTLRAPDSEAATVLTIIEGDVRVESASGLHSAVSGMLLSPKDRVVTAPGARAVLTFFDGSTVTLDSDTVVVLTGVRNVDGRLKVNLDQRQGNTWTYIPLVLGPAQIQIDTPSARVQTREGAFETRVTDAGGTEVGAQSSGVVVEASGQRSEVAGGSRTAVDAAGNVATSAVAETPREELVVQVGGRTSAYVTDPRGATAGIVAGVPVSQIAGATVSQEGNQVTIRVPNPASGAYVLGLGNDSSGAASVAAAVRSADGGTVSQSLALVGNEAATIDVNAQTSQLAIASTSRDPGSVPAGVAVPTAVVEKANVVATAAAAATVRPAPSVTPLPSSTPSPRPTDVPASTATATPRPSFTPTSTFTFTATPIETPRPKATNTPTPTPRRNLTPVTTPEKVVTVEKVDGVQSLSPATPVSINAR